MFTISLKKLHFHAKHGVFPEEQKTGNNFIIDLDVSYEETGQSVKELNQTIDYGELYSLIKERMLVPSALLETVAQDIVYLIHKRYPQVKRINLSITKSTAPLLSFNGSVQVSLLKEF